MPIVRRQHDGAAADPLQAPVPRKILGGGSVCLTMFVRG